MNSSRLPAIPLLGSEEAFQLRPLPHPLAVQSSLLTSVAYDRDRAIVPVQSYQELLRAASHGAYFNRHIRSLFRYVLLPPV